MVPIMPVIVSMVVVMIVMTVIVVAAGMPRDHDDNLGLRFRRNQSEQPEDSQGQQKVLFHMVIAIVVIAHLPVYFPTIISRRYTLMYSLRLQKCIGEA
jgi:hypothetical protein